tara:strand:+ start:818 stop:1660 length:843 start_codon:yes stop_codon:yes gene_type:complete
VNDLNVDSYKKLYSGKIRDVYEYDQEHLLIVTTDRISAFDYVFEEEVLGKGSLLNKMSIFWFKLTNGIIKNHYIDKLPKIDSNLISRSMLVKKTKVLPVEAIVRGHIAGSAWKSYQENGSINGIKITSGLCEYDRLSEPMFTPSTKSNKDENISISEMKDMIGEEVSNKIIKASFDLYNFAYEYSKNRGIIIADTKFEFGLNNNQDLVLIDEIFTPDCSRFLKLNADGSYDLDAFDKQYFRNYLLANNWNKNQIKIPSDIKKNLMNKYQVAYDLITKNNG